MTCDGCRMQGARKWGVEGACFLTGARCWTEAKREEALSIDLSGCARTALRLFHSCSTQWHVGMAGFTGLDYTAVATAAPLLGYDLTPGVFALVRHLESEQMGLWAEHAEAEKAARAKK